MKFAFSSLICPEYSLETLAAKAREFGYDGVELAVAPQGAFPGSNGLLRDPAHYGDLFAGAGVQVACLASPIQWNGKRHREATDELARYVDAAKTMKCPWVRIQDPAVRRGENLAEASTRFAAWLAPLADSAAERGVGILVENSTNFRTGREMWLIMEMVNHPAVAVCWDVLTGVLAGEDPSVSVPVLNTRMQYLQVKDARNEGGKLAACRLGDGALPLRPLFNRLRGIGYDGWVTCEWEGSGDLGPPALPDALARLREWTQPPQTESAKKKPAAHAATVS